MNSHSTDNLEHQAKQRLDESIEELDPAITRRLQQARYAALEKAGRQRNWMYFPQLKYATLAIVVVAVSIFYNVHERESTQVTLAMESDIEMLTSNESLELMQDLEFMQWLAESDQHVS